MGTARRNREAVSSVLPFLTKKHAEDLPPEPIVGYLRKSSESEDKQVRSTAQQRDKITQKFGEMSLNLWFEDNGVSGRSFDRPEFQRLLAFCRANKQPAGQPGRIAIYDVSRFGRIVNDSNQPDVDGMEFMRLQLKQLGWHLAWVEGPNSENDLVNHFLRIMNSQMASEETSILSVKATAGKADAAIHGWWPGGKTPFGARRFNTATKRLLVDYTTDPDTGNRISGERGHQRSVILVRNEETAPVLEKMMKEYVKGTPIDTICGMADKLSPQPLGRRWYHSTFTYAITNPALIGEMHHNLKGGLRVVKMNWEPIVDPTLWHQVKAEYERRSLTRNSSALRREYILDSLFCAECGAPYYGEVNRARSKPDKPFISYRHYTDRINLGPAIYDRMVKAGCKAKRIPTKLIEDAVKDLLLAQRTTTEYAKHLKMLHADMMAAVEDSHDEVARAEAEVVRLKKRQQKLLDLAADQDDKQTASELMAKYNALKPEIQSAEYEVERKHLAVGATKEMWSALELCMDQTKDILEAWDSMGFEARMAVVRWWVLNIDIQLPKIAPKFKCPVVLQIYLRTLPEIPATVLLETGVRGTRTQMKLGESKALAHASGESGRITHVMNPDYQLYVEKFEVVVVAGIPGQTREVALRSWETRRRNANPK